MELRGKEDSVVTVTTYRPEETETTGKALGTLLVSGDVVGLFGELGAGKTCFTRGLARGLGIEKNVPIVSPSFTLINEYPGRIPLFHFDCYRIDSIARMYDLGYQEYFYGNGVTVIEWGEKIAQFLPEEHLRVYFSFIDEEVRELTFRAQGQRFIGLLKQFTTLMRKHI